MATHQILNDSYRHAMSRFLEEQHLLLQLINLTKLPSRFATRSTTSDSHVLSNCVSTHLACWLASQTGCDLDTWTWWWIVHACFLSFHSMQSRRHQHFAKSQMVVVSLTIQVSNDNRNRPSSSNSECHANIPRKSNLTSTFCVYGKNMPTFLQEMLIFSILHKRFALQFALALALFFRGRGSNLSVRSLKQNSWNDTEHERREEAK